MKAKRLIAMLLCAMMLVSLLPAAVFADEEEEIIEVAFDAEEILSESEEEEPAEEPEAGEEPAEEPEFEEETAQEEDSEDAELPAEPETEEEENEFETTIIASGSCGEGVYWSLDSDGLLSITGNGAMKDFPSYRAPWITYKSDIIKAEVSYGVTSVGNFAFTELSNVTSIRLPQSVKSIGRDAFQSCTQLKTVNIPAEVTVIGENTFTNCENLPAIALPTGLKKIGADAFWGCAALKQITINADVTEIGIDAFGNCAALTAIKVIAANTSYKSVDGVLFTADGKTLVQCPAGKTGEYTIPAGTEVIMNYAFDRSEFSFVTVPASVKRIGISAFLGAWLDGIKFLGNAPVIEALAFDRVIAAAYYPAGNSSWDNSKLDYGGWLAWEAYSTHPVPVLQTPANHENFMIIQWSKCEGATGYRLQYREGNGAWTEVKVALTQVNSKGEPRWDYKGAKDGATYTFRVFADFADGTSTESNRVGQMRLRTPKIKVSHFGGSDSTGGFRVDWEATTGGSQYKIYYREKGGSWALYTMIPKNYNVLFTNIKASVTNANPALPNLVAGHTYEFMVLTCTSQASVTSGYPTPFVSMKF